MGRKKKNKKSQPPERPGPMRWTFPPDIPTNDFFDARRLTEMWDLQEAVENFVYWLEEDGFLTWEAVVCQEQGLPLTAAQQEAIDGLLNFGDPDDDQILDINEIPRPSEPWYAILNKLVPHLLIEPFRTFDIHEEVKIDGWPQIMTALEEHGQHLSLPTSASRSIPFSRG